MPLLSCKVFRIFHRKRVFDPVLVLERRIPLQRLVNVIVKVLAFELLPVLLLHVVVVVLEQTVHIVLEVLVAPVLVVPHVKA